MSNFTKIISAAVIRDEIHQVPKRGGVYKQYVDADGLKLLDGVNPSTVENVNGENLYLIYI